MQNRCFEPSGPLLDSYAPVQPVAQCPSVRVHQAPDFFAFWDAWEHEAGTTCDIPFWCVVWPAAAVLSAYIMAHPEIVRGASVLDLGSGGGCCAIVAALCGAAHVVANDIDPLACTIAARNARYNNVTLTYAETDYVASHDRAAEDVILVSDMFYEEKVSATHFAWLKTQYHSFGKRIFIADAQRPFLPLSGIEKLYGTTMEVDRDLEGVYQREVSILTFDRE